MFGSSESEAELLQAARAFDLSQIHLQADDEQRDAAAGLHQLSGASGLESEEEDERAVTSPIAPPRRQRIPLKIDTDVNVLQDGESSSEYEDSSSDVSDSAGICDDDGDSGSGKIDEEGGDEISDSAAAEMNEAFLASLHIGGNAELSKAALKQRAAALRTMQWTPFMTEFETDTSAYPGLGADGARPVGELLDVRRSSLLTLFFFVPKTVWVSIAKETNRYFLKQVGKRAERMAARQNGRQRGTAAQIVRLLKAPEGYGVHEILRVIGLLVARMLCGALLRIGPWSRTAPFQLDSSGGTCRTIAAKTSCVTYTSLPTPPITAAINCGSCVLSWTRSKNVSWLDGRFQPSFLLMKAFFLPRRSAPRRACSCRISRTDTAPNYLCCVPQRHRTDKGMLFLIKTNVVWFCSKPT
jgi:hypothetical protein